MTPYEKLSTEYNKIYEFASGTYNETGHELMDRITMLNIYLARSGRMLAESNFLYDAKVESVLAAIPIKEYPPSILKDILKGKTRNESLLCKCIERLNATIVHQIDGIRSQLSYLKSELQNLN